MDLDLWVRLLHHGQFLGLPDTLAAFRVNGQSLSAENDAAVYGHQKAIMDELVASPYLQLRYRDEAIGRLAAPPAGCAGAPCSTSPTGRPAAPSAARPRRPGRGRRPARPPGTRGSAGAAGRRRRPA